MSKIREEVRHRVPRLTMSLVLAVIFWIISAIVPGTVRGVAIPGLSVDASFLVWAITIAITAIFLIRALSDALILGDIVTDIIVRRLGIKEERSPKRAGRDLIYIIILILIATAILPVANLLLEENLIDVANMIIIYGTLGIVIILIYDIGRIIYKIMEQRAESLAERLSKLVEQEETSE